MTDITTVHTAPAEAMFSDRQPLRDRVYTQLVGLLTAGEYRPGDHLPERLLSERFGVSRGPVREAIRLLERDGWVSFRSGRGSYVRLLTEDEVDEVYEARMVVEAASARLAAIRVPSTGCPQLFDIVDRANQLFARPDNVDALSMLTIRFHHEVSELSGNTFLIEFSERIRTMSHRVVATLTPRIAPQAWKEHADIATAIRVGDAALAENLMRDHLMWSRRTYRQSRSDSGKG